MDNCLKANEQIQNQTREGDLSEVLRQVRQDEGGGDASRQEFTMFLQPEQVTSQWSLSDVGVSSPDVKPVYLEGGARYEQHVIDGGDSRGYAVPGPTQHYAQISGPPDTFSVGVSSQNKSSKNLDYVVGVGVDGTTLYCKADVMVPFIFTQPRNHYRSGAVRIKAEYIEDRYASRAVERCPNHRFKDESILRNHFVRSELQQAAYRGEEEGYAVIIPICDSTGLAFTCFSSCSGGINRRAVRLVFSLEKGHDVIASCTVILKVCANPLRDASKENVKLDVPSIDVAPRKRPNKIGEEITITKRTRPNIKMEVADDDEIFEIRLRGTEKYRAVMKYLAELEGLERYKGMKHEMDGLGINPFREVSKVHKETTIKAWLSQDAISLGHYAEAFHQQRIYTLGQLSEVFQRDLFERLGVRSDEAAVLNKVFMNWDNTMRSTELNDSVVSQDSEHH